jgi:hypothetical protein
VSQQVAPQRKSLANAFVRQPLVHVALSDATTSMVSAYCARRRPRVNPGTTSRELRIIDFWLT